MATAARRRDLTTPSGRPLAPLALAAHPETPGACLDVALAGGVNAFFLYDLQAADLLDALAGALPSCRSEVAVITGSEARDAGGLHRDVDALCARLRVDVLDVFLLLYVAPTEDVAVTDGLLDELVALREAGRIRHAGVSVHDRGRARAFATDPRVDVLMHRYNMAHRGAEEFVLPTAQQRGLPVIAFTCTRWRTLLAGHAAWQAPPPTASECYRFALAQPAVGLVLSAPRTLAQLRENLAVLDALPLRPDELRHWRAYGDLVYGGRPGDFETSWP